MLGDSAVVDPKRLQALRALLSEKERLLQQVGKKLQRHLQHLQLMMYYQICQRIFLKDSSHVTIT